MLKYIFTLLFIAFILSAPAQHLQPGFDKREFIELLKIGAYTTARPSYFSKISPPEKFALAYQSPVIGLDNLWQLWTSKDSVGVISIRGTTNTVPSLIANFYAAMVAAKGTLQLEKDFTFNYTLSDDPKAAVHVGYLIAAAYISRDILPKIDSCYKQGIHEFIIAGHSQGGAITYSLTSYLEQMKKENRLAKDIRFKTCASGSPKPGNLFYAYTFEDLTRDGWSYNVVNTVDWVPELPFSVQTVNDFNETNPFRNAKKLVKKQKFPVNLALLHAFNRMDKPSRRAQRNYERWLGKRASIYIKKSLKEFTTPEYYGSNNYVRTGTTIILYPDSTYFQKFPEVRDSIWHNHIHAPYLFLTEKLPGNNIAEKKVSRIAHFADTTDLAKLNGSWELDYIGGKNIPFDSLYPRKKPVIILNIEKYEVNGNTGCNTFNGKFTGDAEHKINFAGPMAITKMFCPGEGEKYFLETLQSINTWSVYNNELTLIIGDIAIMHFKKNTN